MQLAKHLSSYIGLSHFTEFKGHIWFNFLLADMERVTLQLCIAEYIYSTNSSTIINNMHRREESY